MMSNMSDIKTDTNSRTTRSHHAARPWWQRLFIALLAIYLGVMGAMMLFEEKLVYHPHAYPYGDWKLPERAEDVNFTALDGTRLHGWFFAQDKPQTVILYLHGNGGNVAMWAFEGQRLREQQQAAVFVFDYRGYGRSEGSPSEQGILSDARGARAWLAQRTGVAERDVVLVGRSLGTGAAVDLAATDGARGVILISPYTSLPDIARGVYPWLPAHWLMRNRFDSASKIANYHGPLLVFHGTADTLIPTTLGQRLFEAANEPKRFVPLQGAQHNESPRREYDVAIKEFLSGLSK